MVIPLIVGCAFFMEGLDSTVLAVSIPAMAKTFGVQPLRLNLAITAYLLSLAVFIPVSGWIADRFGTRSVFCAAVLIFTASSALCGAATSLGMLIAMRALQGFGGAMMTPVGRLILLRSFPRSGLVSAMNWMTIPAMVGPTVGPIVGGFLTSYVSWRAIFYLNIPIGLLGAGLSIWLFENFRAPAPTRFDVNGFLIAGIGLFVLELGIENLGRPMLPPAIGYALFPFAAAMLWFYVHHARRSRAPVLDLQLLSIRTFSIGTMIGGVCRMGLDSMPLLIPLLFQVGFGMTPVQSGFLSFWSSLGAMWPSLDESLRDWMQAEAARGLAGCEQSTAAPAMRWLKDGRRFDPAYGALGVLDPEVRVETFYAAVERLVVPRLARLGLDGPRAWEDRYRHG